MKTTHSLSFILLSFTILHSHLFNFVFGEQCSDNMISNVFSLQQGFCGSQAHLNASLTLNVPSNFASAQVFYFVILLFLVSFLLY